MLRLGKLVHKCRASSVRLMSSGSQHVFTERRLVGYTCQQLFNVISKVEDYHLFLPWCTKSVVTLRRPNILSANLSIGFPPLRVSYTSHVTMIEPHLVTAVCTDINLFKHLKTVWKLTPNNEGQCEVDFAVAYEFVNWYHSYVARMFIDEVTKKNMSAFLTRAQQLYGPGKETDDKVTTQTLTR